MSRRVRLPGADELFRGTGVAEESGAGPAPDRSAAPPVSLPRDRAEEPAAPIASGGPAFGGQPNGAGAAAHEAAAAAGTQPRPRNRRRPHSGERRPSGRERHEEKITVYCSAEELFDLEHARLTLRGEHGLAIDRGRIVREALAVVLADLEAKGESSILVRRLQGR